MPKTITFYKLSERKPDDNEEIFFIRTNPLYQNYSIELGTVSYCWFEYDDMGFTGVQYVYGGEKEVEDCKLKLMIDKFTFPDDSELLWAPASSFDSLVVG